MLLHFWENPIADYQQVTDSGILPNFQNNFPSQDFISRKSRFEKSKCKEKGAFCDKVIFCFVLPWSRNLTFHLSPFTLYATTDCSDEHRFLTSVINI